MSMPFGPGSPRIQVLGTDLVTPLKTLYLPVPTKLGSELTWIRSSIPQELIPPQGRRERLLGFYPKLTLTWDVYDDLNGYGRTFGQADGNILSYQDLEAILSLPPRHLKVSPGPAPAGGFRALVTKDPAPKLVGPSFAKGVTVEFTGWDLLSTKTLGSF